MINKSLYHIIFSDGSVYIGGNYIDSKWINIPNNKKIKRVVYSLPNGDNLVLNGYYSYFHMCEATVDLSGKNKGKRKLEFDYIMGKRRGLVIVYKINIITGKMEKIIYKEEDNFIKKLNKNGWKGKKKEEEMK